MFSNLYIMLQLSRLEILEVDVARIMSAKVKLEYNLQKCTHGTTFMNIASRQRVNVGHGFN